MLDIEQVKEAIREIENGPTTFTNCEKLASLYAVLDHNKGVSTPRAAEYKESVKSEKDYYLDMEAAMEWSAKMQNEDGTTGAHWNMEQTKQVMAQKNIDLDPVEFYLAMNMMYSDYCKVAKKLNVNNVDFYAHMARAFLEDQDGGSDKLMRYYKYVVM